MSQHFSEDPAALAAFLKDLTALAHKHGIIIGGCGCCSSPYLQDIDASDSGSVYQWSGDGSQELWFGEPEPVVIDGEVNPVPKALT